MAWAARIAVNTCMHHRRRDGRAATPLTAIAEPAAAVHSGPDPEVQAHLAAALEELPAEQREAVALRYLAGLDFAAVATAAGVRQGAARMRVQRGLAALRTALDRRGVAVTALVLAAGLEDLASAAVPPPPPAATAAWSAAPLQPVTTPLATPSTSLFTSHLGAITVTTAIAAAGLIAALALPALWPAPQPAPAPVEPQEVSAALPAPQPKDILAWLAQRQAADGSWGGDGQDTIDVLLIFAGAGYDHLTPSPYRTTVAAAVSWLVAHPGGARPDDVRQVAGETSVLYDLMFVTVTSALQEPAAAALQRLLALQRGDGWPAVRDQKTVDLAATARAVYAVRSAQLCGGLGEASRSGVNDPHALEIPDGAALQPLLERVGRMVGEAYANSRMAVLPEQLPGVPPFAGMPNGDVAALAIAAGIYRTNRPAWAEQLATRVLATDPSAWTPEQCFLRTLAMWTFSSADQCLDSIPALHVAAERQMSAALAARDMPNLTMAFGQELRCVQWKAILTHSVPPAPVVPVTPPAMSTDAPVAPRTGKS